MSTVQKQMDNMNNIGEGGAIVGEDESEQKGIAGLNELLEQELKEDDSVDRYIPLHCFMDEDVRRYTSKFRLSHEDDGSVVPDATLYSPKEGASTDNNSSTLETELEIPDNREKEVPLKITSDAENLQSCEEGNASETVVKSVETADQGTNEIRDTGEEDIVNKNGLDPVRNKEESSLVSEEVESSLKDQINEEHNDVEQNSKGSSEEETNKGREIAEEAQDSAEVVSQSEVQNSVVPKESEEAANSQSAQEENATGVSKDILYDVLPPEDEKTECKDNTTSTGTINTSNPVPDKPVLSPVLKIPSSGEAINVKEIHKPIIITARLVKNDSEVTTKTADNCLVSDNINREHIVTSLKSFRLVKVSAVTTKAADNFGVLTSREDTVSSTKSVESEEKKHKSDEPKGEESKKEVQNDDAVNSNVSTPKVILTKKVYGNTKRSPLSVQEKKVPSTEASSADTQNHHHTADEDKDMNMDNGVKASVNTKVLVGNEGKTSIKTSVLEKKVDGSCTAKEETDFAAVKRKFEEVSRISRQEEEAAVKEIKRMKKETLDVLKKINGEMKKLKLIFLAGN